MTPIAYAAGLFAGFLVMSSPAFTADAQWVITPDGLGPLKIGMTLAQASKALGARLTIDAHDSDAVSCSELDVPDKGGLGMMFENRRLTRIAVFKPSHLKTTLGIGIGSTEAEVKAKYKPLDDKPQAYDELPAKDLTWWATKDKRGIRFQTDTTKHVKAIFAGNSAITYVEGCE